ncbi:coproporphyrinogen III oxidase [Salmonella enterica]|nr:coproporphyrinogen III oxidase [Salmonella enterica]ECB8203171.1 coproporphyrinogen III oxidase [Salmonella enterica subsp. enterica serovar Derby]
MQSGCICTCTSGRSSITVTNGAIVIHTQRLKSDPGGNLLS